MELGFLLKKFVTFFVEPFGIVFTLFIVGVIFLYMKKEFQSKITLSLSLFLLFMFSYPPFANFLVQNLEMQYPKYDYKQDIEYIHVLGSGHNTDQRQPLSSHIMDAGTKRVLEGVIIHKQIENSKIIFTGHKGRKDIAHAEMSSKLSMALGVDKKNIIISTDQKETQDEAVFIKTLVGTKPFVLVTSATHMPRSMMLFKQEGLNPIAAPTAYHTSDFRGYLRAPSVTAFKISTIAMHEYIGIVWTRIKG
ncbi:MAG: ElyC/SanA/YdcF family protein [Campylobacterota bacterium]|nr:ElyC/SanA/YdcF family protein [Campylobacterota bacterium]